MSEEQPYASVDEIVDAWCRANSLVLFTSFAGEQRRFCYVSSRRGECLQIAIEPPDEGSLQIHVSDIETLEDEELHLTWTAPISQLRPTLDIALKAVHDWFERSK